MYQKKIVFENVQQYFICKEKGIIVITEKDNTIKAINSGTFELIWQTDKYFGVQQFREDVIVLVDYEYKPFYVNVDNGEINVEINEKFKKYSFSNFSDSLGYYTSKNLEGYFYKDGIYDFRNDKKLWEFKYVDANKQILSLNYFIQWHREKILETISIQTGEKIWEFSANKIGVFFDDQILQSGSINGVLGLFGLVLVVIITGGGNKLRGSEQLIGLHIQTGELLWLLSDFEYEGVKYNALPTIATLQADKNHQYLIGFQGGSFIEIAPETGKVLRYKKGITQYDRYTLTKPIDSFSLQGDYLYFRTVIASIGGWPTAIGAFNYQTEQIEWLHVFEKFKKQGCFLPIGQPKVEGNRVYALDSGGTLHIFEKEG
ncbi:hypothetical protein [Emticicia sp. C21]|uniref:hypothetical protein n=1 Tax=Emticicia sp. C21 TaxID=2302915 RepID=UPI000E34F54F|nr:hypothetical protein [Emticicia sp. C21]RFS17298.1 hypothetical protein D0T08_05820 [Emticicia sp. C21]